MRLALVAATLLAAAFAQAGSAAPTSSATYHGVKRAEMIAAVKVSPLKLIDPEETYCDGATPIGAWLERLTAGEARGVAWTAGPCELVNSLNPIDAGGADCVQATIRLKHPLSRDDEPVIEIYLESPKRGRPGAAYAFRDVFVTDGGADYERERRIFEAQWRERFKDAPAPACEDD